MNMICNIDGCNKEVAVKKRGLCRSHFCWWSAKNKPRGKKPCAIEGCTGHVYSRKFCRSHYDRFKRYGNPVGSRERTVQFCECGEVVQARGMCKRCYGNWLYYNGQGLRGGIKTDEPSYSLAHARLRKERGRAAIYECELCGGPAREWALSAGAQELLFGVSGTGRKNITAYSMNPYDYFPACSPCHRAYDSEYANRSFVNKKSRWEE